MGTGKTPGPTSTDKLTGPLHDGTSTLGPSPAPGPIGSGAPASLTRAPAPASIGASPSAKPAAGGAAAAVDHATDPAIEALNLRSTAKKAAYKLKKAHPSVVFTSGRRNKRDQARAMASNVVLNRKWIQQTYASSKASKACQKWVDDHPDKKTKAEIEEGLAGVLDTLTDADLAQLSKHLSGDAFDVKPVTGHDADAIKKTIRGLPGLSRFLDKEGGLVRWHAQF